MKIYIVIFLFVKAFSSFVSSPATPSTTLQFTEQDEYFIQRAIELASLGNGRTAPNPCVGCVLVSDNGEVISEGYHKMAGTNHAEAEAILAATSNKTKYALLKGSTAYVSLEPCNHYGRTPPCSDALIRNGIRRVIVSMVDPDPRVSGKGLQNLRRNGLEVKCGLKADIAKELNAPFIYRVLTKRPYSICWIQIDTKGNGVNSLVVPKLESVVNLLNSRQIANEVDTISLSTSDYSPEAITSTNDWNRIIELLPSHVSLVLQVHVYDTNESVSIHSLQDLLKANSDLLKHLPKPLVDLYNENQFAQSFDIGSKKIKVAVISSSMSCGVMSSPHAVASHSCLLTELARQGCNAVLLFPSQDFTSTADGDGSSVAKYIESLTQLGFVQKCIVSSPATTEALGATSLFLKSLVQSYRDIHKSNYLRKFLESENKVDEVEQGSEVAGIDLDKLETINLSNSEDEYSTDSSSVKMSHFSYKMWGYRVPQDNQ